MSRSRRAPERGSRRDSVPGVADSGTWVEISGRVERLLHDDDEDGGHQRLIVGTGDGRTILVAHNLSLCERVPAGLGDRVRVRGRFEWNELGGMLHWTHHDPFGREPGGYIRLRDRTYR